MIKIEKALVTDAAVLLEIQRNAFEIYSKRYGDFDSNPYHMELDRLEFNLLYRFGQYYKIILLETNQIIGGIFGFYLDDNQTMKIAQFYLQNEYQSLGYGKNVLEKFISCNPNVKKWYVDTIMQEEYNVAFYKHFGFEVIDEEEEHEGLTFVTLLKRC